MSASSPATWRSAGYFTCFRYILGLKPHDIERRIGYSPDTLREGWRLYRPTLSIPASFIRLKGSSRFSGGKLIQSSGNSLDIEQLIDARYEDLDLEVSGAREKVSNFFRKSHINTPVKVSPNRNSGRITYPPAFPVGLPQFTLAAPIDWKLIHEFRPGEIPCLWHLR